MRRACTCCASSGHAGRRALQSVAWCCVDSTQYVRRRAETQHANASRSQPRAWTVNLAEAGSVQCIGLMPTIRRSRACLRCKARVLEPQRRGDDVLYASGERYSARSTRHQCSRGEANRRSVRAHRTQWPLHRHACNDEESSKALQLGLQLRLANRRGREVRLSDLTAPLRAHGCIRLRPMHRCAVAESLSL